MKQIIGFTILAVCLFGCIQTKQAPEAQIKIVERIVYRDTCDSEFIRKIGEIESGGIDSTVAEHGRGRGRYGIYNICVKGSGLADLLRYSHKDMNTKEKSDRVFWAVMGIFCHLYAQKHGHYPTYEELARMWAGGSEGYKSNATLNYLNKFRTL
jgi:hypothetical protein